ncbi:MAG: NADPH:quinone oxidoreductase family protein [Sphingomonadaceae bacterium]|uniref:NADPH:quinone oxidoreductase family protein n=1 Tax=Thermaurantiacus sp. TaxID=2820283 RepID=UPI00298F09F0|nr:NADPH:quinone oxidoreductase family protein [Thermaurantiacus sp.]MCS6985850.1 NADPH:quinone oxidoreductase family protein [Sphingomonadaceae bacterium]MDW8413881.1 NADPH:quinone oxidoreductase family protein [Thermaurantiacus sp.]
MKAILCVEHGEPEKLAWTEVPDPEPGPGQVRIAVRAAGVNFPETLIIRNLYQFKPPLPFVPGGEAAGIVEAVGEGVTRVAPGQAVIAMTGTGAFAEKLLAHEHQLVPLPDGVPFDLAAGFVMTYGTSHHALRQRAALRPGETLLVLGAAGGVGLAAVEIGALLGARVIAAASSAEKLELARQHGAAFTLNYETDDLKERVKELTGGQGADVVYDPVGGRFAEPAFRSIAWNGRYLVVGFAAGDIPRLPLNLPLIKGAAIVGVFWGAFIQREPDVHAANMEELLGWWREGRLRPHVGARLPLREGAKAIRLLMDRQAMGKVILINDVA